MHDHIIIGYDGSEAAAAAAAWAADEAVRRQVGLTVLGCYMEPTTTDFGLSSVFESAVKTITVRATSQAHVDELAVELTQSHPGLTVNASAVHGRPQRQLVEQAEQSNLLVVGSTGAGGSPRSLLGSVTRAVVRDSPCPVVVVPGQHASPEVPHVVVGVDGTRRSAAALQWAVDETDLLRGQLVVLHAYSYPYGDDGHSPSAARDILRIDAARQLEQAVDRARTRGGSKVEGQLVEGHPANEIIAGAHGADADLIVVGTRQQSHGLAVFGSVAEAVVCHAPCPVAVIREDLKV